MRPPLSSKPCAKLISKMARRTLLLVVILLMALGTPARAERIIPSPAASDGIWFVGFNLHKDIFSGESGAKVRKAVEAALSRDKIAAAAKRTVPQTGFI